MQTGEPEQDAWSAVPLDLHAFALGPWQCALGPQQASDVSTDATQTLSRSRRLACTHESGATVQTELHCALTLPPASGSTESARRELPLVLSAAPPLRLACEPARMDALATQPEPPPHAACEGTAALAAEAGCTAP